jgi:hypothetical protein
MLSPYESLLLEYGFDKHELIDTDSRITEMTITEFVHDVIRLLLRLLLLLLLLWQASAAFLAMSPLAVSEVSLSVTAGSGTLASLLVSTMPIPRR